MQEWNDVHTNEVAFTKYTHFVGTGIASGPLSFPPASVTGSGRVTCMSHKPRKRPPHALYPWSPCHYVASKVQRREHWIHHSLLPVNSMKNTFSTYSESESCSVVSDSLHLHGLQPTRFLCSQDSGRKKKQILSHFTETYIPVGLLRGECKGRSGELHWIAAKTSSPTAAQKPAPLNTIHMKGLGTSRPAGQPKSRSWASSSVTG